MYWSRTRSVADILALLLFLALCTAGGWFLVRAGFRLSSKDRVVVGAGLGLTLAAWLGNLLSPLAAPPACVLGSGGVSPFVEGPGGRRGRVGLDAGDVAGQPSLALDRAARVVLAFGWTAGCGGVRPVVAPVGPPIAPPAGTAPVAAH